MRVLAVALAGAVALALGSCMDPVHSKAVDDLGPEVEGIREGPRHRAGQPCSVCHGGAGPGSPDFVAGGTVYEDTISAAPIAKADVQVILTDVRGASISTFTNDVGNFYVTTREWSPTYPLFVTLEHNGAVKKMETPIGRDGGCAVCHRGSGDSAHMPVVGFKDSKDLR